MEKFEAEEGEAVGTWILPHVSWFEACGGIVTEPFEAVDVIFDGMAGEGKGEVEK